MDLNQAKDHFKRILLNLTDQNQKDAFLSWIQNDYFRANCQQPSESKVLNKISNYLKNKFPYGSKLAHENLLDKVNGINASSDLDKTIEIDGFMYDDDDIDELVDKGLINRYYCKNCNSKNVEPYNFITHSVPKETLYEIFNYYLSEDMLNGRKILDVGSRIGAFLFGSYVYSKNTQIIGIEMNKDLCLIQQDIVDQFKFNDRIKIVNDDVMNCSELVSTGDFIFLHNVFEFFISNDHQLMIWKFLKENIKKGAILITIPSLKEMTKNLLEDEFFENWLVMINSTNSEDDDHLKVYLYEVI